MRIAITGASGQLGSELCRQLGEQAIPLCYPEFDLTSVSSVRSTLAALRPDALINAAAYTQVDKAEEDVATCMSVNGSAVGTLAEVCAERDCPLVQISTDYVFDDARGSTPWRETDPPQARGIYARSKLRGEALAATWGKHFIVRTCGLYDALEDAPIRGRNFVDTMLCLGQERDQLSVVSDQTCTPTFVPHLAEALRFLLTTDAYGLYHVTNTGATTWFDFAAEIFRIAELDVELTAITTEQYGAPAPRPRYSALDTSKYAQLAGPPLVDWCSALHTKVRRALART